MRIAYDVSAVKRALNLSINADLVAQARLLTDNLSAEVEILLADFVQRQTEHNASKANRLKRTAAAWNNFSAQHGAFADEFSTL
ncbi:MAG TPA: type II toxin-antitoxin system CcdA family antitoxin [Thermomonas sp.]|mgnify:CR=1 FL=1|jgi:post-segregation antitoxin (ccd killing protein)|uniref:type II toxin-antitoxin system CcdA family antitoxin n=1 Tax=Thermomonas sp. TaxID=1971895 RepID=UPI002C87B1FD|nr:type II toxin-antitoxin system CcdA family antitoxin [Thermomonas sp.]HOV96612.1 type II toxin-antitoxin system CcdA family antitoxin [Thermomonas sp.]